jgi:glutathione reductase (NADPH)
MGVEQFHGRARFVTGTTLAVGPDRLTGRRVLVAAGAVPARLGFPGADRLVSSEDFLNLDRLPPRIVFAGGGYIAFEFAHVAAGAGVEVTILHRGARPLEAWALTCARPHAVTACSSPCPARPCAATPGRSVRCSRSAW